MDYGSDTMKEFWSLQDWSTMAKSKKNRERERERERDFWKAKKRNSISSGSKNTLKLVCLYSIITIHQEPFRSQNCFTESQPPCDHCSVKSGMIAWMTVIA